MMILTQVWPDGSERRLAVNPFRVESVLPDSEVPNFGGSRVFGTNDDHGYRVAESFDTVVSLMAMIVSDWEVAVVGEDGRPQRMSVKRYTGTEVPPDLSTMGSTMHT